ncbi:unnamed protein product [Prunus armeniaca]
MRDDESLSAYLTKLFDLINQIRSYGEDLAKARIVQKLLISLPSAYDSIYYVIEHSKDLDEIEVQEVEASLKSFELRLDRDSRDKIEKAFASLSVNPKSEKYSGSQSGSKDQKNWKTKGKKWDNKSTDGARNPCKHCGKLHFGECRFKGNPKCYNCDKFGHIAKDCYSKKPAQQLNYATQTESTPTMFYASNKGSASVKGCDDVWYLDSRCNNHMTGREDVLVDVDRNITAKVAMATRQLVDVVGKGNLVVDTKMGKRYVKEVLLVVGLKENLLSVGQMMEHGYVLIFGANKVEIYDSSLLNLVAKVQMKGNRSFPLKLHTTLQVALRANVGSSLVWHRRMGHLNFTSLKLLQDQGMVLRLPEIKPVNEVCEGCTFGKHCKYSFPKETTSRATIPLELVHTDVCGPMQTVTKVANRQLTVAYSPQQNGVAERKNRTIMEMAKYMIIEKKMPLELWAEAVNTDVYVQNRCPTKALDKKTPFEAYSGRRPGVKHLRVFGSLCYAHVPTQQWQKLDLASTRCIFLGYGSCEKGYRLYNIASGKMIISKNVILNEVAVWDWNARKECDISIPLNETLTKREEEPSDSSLSQEEISEEEHADPDSGS